MSAEYYLAYNDDKKRTKPVYIECMYNLMRLPGDRDAREWLRENIRSLETFVRIKEITAKLLLSDKRALIECADILEVVLKDPLIVEDIYHLYDRERDKADAFKIDVDFERYYKSEREIERKSLYNILSTIIETHKFPELEQEDEIMAFVARGGELSEPSSPSSTRYSTTHSGETDIPIDDETSLPLVTTPPVSDPEEEIQASSESGAVEEQEQSVKSNISIHKTSTTDDSSDSSTSNTSSDLPDTLSDSSETYSSSSSYTDSESSDSGPGPHGPIISESTKDSKEAVLHQLHKMDGGAL